MSILTTIGRFLGSAFNAWLMKPIYQMIIVLLIIIIIWMYLKQRNASGA